MAASNPSPSVSYQCPLRPALPCIYGPLEYREERDLYQRIDRLLHTTGIEQACITAAFAQSARDWSSATPAAIARFGRYASIGLRCAVARSITGLKAPVHLPTDWVLLRDAVRTLMPATARIDHILTQLPAAIHQAHERIIGGRQVPNGEKILSLYDSDIDLIVRGKAGAEVEFGSKLWLGELESGLIVDYVLLQESQADTALPAPALERLKSQEALKAGLKTAFSDRGIHSAANEKLLESEDLRSGLCPRQPGVLAQRLRPASARRAVAAGRAQAARSHRDPHRHLQERLLSGTTEGKDPRAPRACDRAGRSRPQPLPRGETSDCPGKSQRPSHRQSPRAAGTARGRLIPPWNQPQNNLAVRARSAAMLTKPAPPPDPPQEPRAGA